MGRVHGFWKMRFWKHFWKAAHGEMDTQGSSMENACLETFWESRTRKNQHPGVRKTNFWKHFWKIWDWEYFWDFEVDGVLLEFRLLF